MSASVFVPLPNELRKERVWAKWHGEMASMASKGPRAQRTNLGDSGPLFKVWVQVLVAFAVLGR